MMYLVLPLLAALASLFFPTAAAPAATLDTWACTPSDASSSLLCQIRSRYSGPQGTGVYIYQKLCDVVSQQATVMLCRPVTTRRCSQTQIPSSCPIVYGYNGTIISHHGNASDIMVWSPTGPPYNHSFVFGQVITPRSILTAADDNCTISCGGIRTGDVVRPFASIYAPLGINGKTLGNVFTAGTEIPAMEISQKGFGAERVATILNEARPMGTLGEMVGTHDSYHR